MRKQLGARFSRKAAIDAALAAGVAFYTARTQYQEWKQAGDRDHAHAEKYTVQNWTIIIYNDDGRVMALRPIDQKTKEEVEAQAKDLLKTLGGESFAVQPRK